MAVIDALRDLALVTTSATGTRCCAQMWYPLAGIQPIPEGLGVSLCTGAST